MNKRPEPRSLTLAFSFVSVFVLLAMLLSACGASGTPSTSNSGKPVKGGTWTDDLYETIKNMIPNGNSETFADIVDNTIWAPLYYGDASGNITPGLASEVPSVANGDASADLKTWTVKLRPGLKWSDGTPLNAQDVNFTWQLWNNANFGAASTVGLNLIKSADVSSDNLTITFHLSQAFSPFNSIWADGLEAIMPEHVFGPIAGANLNATTGVYTFSSADAVLKSPEAQQPTVASGPFMVQSATPKVQITVVRNTNYYLASQGLPYLDKIVFRFVTDQDTILKDLQSGSIDSSWFLDVQKTPAYQAVSGYHIVKNPHASNFEAMYFDLNNPLLKDVKLRTAMAMAIDHNALITVARKGQAVPLCTDHGQSYVPGYQADAPCPKFDPTAAKNLLLSAGYTMGSDGYLIDPTYHKKLEFQYSTTANNAWRAQDELILQQDFKAIGVQIDIKNYDGSTFFGSVLPGGKPGTYDLAEFENSFTYDADDASAFACNQVPSAANQFGGGNFSFYCNPALDKLFIQEETTGDPAQRQAIFNQEHQIYLTDYPFATLYSPVDIAMLKNVGHNYLPGPEGASETVGVWNWWCDGGHC